MNLGLLLDAYRKSRDLSLRQFAAELGLKHTNLHHIIHGYNTRSDHLLRIFMWMLDGPAQKRRRKSFSPAEWNEQIKQTQDISHD